MKHTLKVLDDSLWIVALLFVLTLGFLERNYSISSNYIVITSLTLVVGFIVLFTLKMSKGIKEKQWRIIISIIGVLAMMFLYT